MNFYFIINFYLFIIYSSNYEFMFASNFYIFIHFLFLFVSFSIYLGIYLQTGFPLSTITCLPS